VNGGPNPVVDLHDVRRRYELGGETVHALRGVSLRVDRGEYVAIMGPSGSGKSTLMNIVGCLDRADAGRYLLDGTDVLDRTEDELATIRNRKIGFVFQQFNLVTRASALENVELPLAYAAAGRRDRRRRAEDALRTVGLAQRMDHLPSELSGGQQQRVAIARAIVTNPAMILADEPTGALDASTTADVTALLQELNDAGRTVVVITHDDEVGEGAQRIVSLRDGAIADDRATVAVARQP